MTRRYAFTLIELLVVVAIIVALLAILLPSMNRAIMAAESVVCSSNLRQLSVAQLSYASDNQTVLMAPDWGLDSYWVHHILPYVGESVSAVDADTGERTATALICPAASDVASTSGVWNAGTATTAWWNLRGLQAASSYANNQWVGVPGAIAASNPGMLPVSNHFQTLGSVVTTSNTPAFADAIWFGGWPLDNDPVPFDLQRGSDPFGPSPNIGMGRYCIDRHDMAINVGMLDGSSHRTALGDLWALKWHRTFTTGAIDVP